jgi:hypothetical protein
MDRDFSQDEFDPCPGGFSGAIATTGHEHLVMHLYEDNAGGMHFDVASDVQGSGTGVDPLNPLKTASWTIKDSQFASTNIPGPPDTSASTSDLYYKAMKQGENALPDDFLSHELIHSTVANGVVTVAFDKGAPKCV